MCFFKNSLSNFRSCVYCKILKIWNGWSILKYLKNFDYRFCPSSQILDILFKPTSSDNFSTLFFWEDESIFWRNYLVKKKEYKTHEIYQCKPLHYLYLIVLINEILKKKKLGHLLCHNEKLRSRRHWMRKRNNFYQERS